MFQTIKKIKSYLIILSYHFKFSLINMNNNLWLFYGKCIVLLEVIISL